MNIKTEAKTILIAPLNWGLGHATRCIPIIRALLKNNYIPIIASDGIALALLRKEFPRFKHSNSHPTMLNMLRMGPILNGTNTEWPKMIRAISRKKIIQDWLRNMR
jgi:UDP:flavonoid glycosyltransferase YjiC (YdhE family)